MGNHLKTSWPVRITSQNHLDRLLKVQRLEAQTHLLNSCFFFFLSSTHCSDATGLTASQEVHALGTGSVVGHTRLSKAHVFCLMVEIPVVQGVCLKYVNATCVPFPFHGCAHPLNQLASDISLQCYGFCSRGLLTMHFINSEMHVLPLPM